MKHSIRGFTLIELLVAMALLSTILTVVAVALGGLARADRKSRDRIDRQRSVQRFIMRLRQDIHEASDYLVSPGEDSPADSDLDASPSTPDQALILTRDAGHTIRFQPTEHGITRTVAHNETEQHHESYAWGSRAATTWTIDTTQALPMAILTLEIDGGSAHDAEQHVVRTTLINFQPNTDE